MPTDFSDDRDDLERLLDGQGDDVRSPRLWRLAGLLRGAAAPARPHELSGEDDALAAFRAARRGSAPAHRARLGLSTVKVVAAVIAVALGSGTAAVAAGLVPVAVLHIGTSARVSPTGGEGQEGRSATPAPTVGRLPGGPVPGPSVADRQEPSGGATATGAPFPVGDLCTLYLTSSESQRPHMLIEARFAPLVSLAGDPESVDEYCAQILMSASPSPSESPSPTPSASPSPTPSASPSPSPSTLPEASSSPARKPPKRPGGAISVQPTSTPSTTVSSFASTSARSNKSDLSWEGLRYRWPVDPIHCGVHRLKDKDSGSFGTWEKPQAMG